MTLLVAVFNQTTDWSGKTITYEEAAHQFILQDNGPIVAQDVLNYDAQGQVDWAKASLHEWVHDFAEWEYTHRLKTEAGNPPSTSHPMLKALADLGYMVQELVLLNQNTKRPSREAATKLAVRCSSLATEVNAWRASFPGANPLTMRLCDCTVTFAGAIAATLLTPDDLTDSELQQGYRDYQSSRVAFNEAVNNWYDYVEQLASSEGVQVTYDLKALVAEDQTDGSVRPQNSPELPRLLLMALHTYADKANLVHNAESNFNIVMLTEYMQPGGKLKRSSDRRVRRAFEPLSEAVIGLQASQSVVVALSEELGVPLEAVLAQDKTFAWANREFAGYLSTLTGLEVWDVAVERGPAPRPGPE
jgi:hypothetical protein